MALIEQVELTKQELDAIAWRFLGSEFTAQSYANWPIDRRVDAYLLHHGLVEFVNDGAAYSALLERVMANVGHAIREGLLAPPHIQGRVERPSVRQLTGSGRRSPEPSPLEPRRN